MIRHAVMWKLSATSPAEQKADADLIAAALAALPALIPQICALTVGSNCADHPGNWDLALVVDFASMADLDAYRVHPEHLRVVQIVKARVSQRASVDFRF